MFNLHTVFSLYTGTLPIHLFTLFSLKRWVFFPCLFLFLLYFLNSSFTTFPPSQVCFCDMQQLLCSSLGIRVLICPPFLQPGLASHPKKNFWVIFFVVASPVLVVGMQVGDAGGLFQVTRSSPKWGSSSLPYPVLHLQSFWTSASVWSSAPWSVGSSAPVSVYLNQQFSRSIVPFL